MNLETDEIFHTLSNRRRRAVLTVLKSTESMTVRELTGSVAAREYECAEEALDYKQRKRVYTSLVQTHLPSLASYGIVEYDKDRGTVTALPPLAEFEPYLDDGASVDRAWRATLLSLTGVFAVLAVLLVLDVPYLNAVSPAGVATGAALGLGTLALFHGRRTKRAAAAATAGTRDLVTESTVLGATKRLVLFWR
jgi:hypothetical protein